MTSKRILDRTRFKNKLNLEKFLPIYKNFAPKIYGNTLYTNMSYRNDLGISSRLRIDSEDDFIPEYEYLAYENCTSGIWATGFDRKKQESIPRVFSFIKQHYLFGVYNFPESSTIEEARNQLLLPLLDKILGLDSCATFLALINRIDSDHVSLEIFLLGVADIDDLILADILYSPTLINCRYYRIPPQNSMYWFYKFHIFFYHNPSILNGTACIIALRSKPNFLRYKFFYLLSALYFESAQIKEWVKKFAFIFHMFEGEINDSFDDYLYGRYGEFVDFIQFDEENTTKSPLMGILQFHPDLTSSHKWWGVNRGLYE